MWDSCYCDETMNGFEAMWTKWDINDVILWFEYILTKNEIDNMNYANKLDRYSTPKSNDQSQTNNKRSRNDDDQIMFDSDAVRKQMECMKFFPRINLPLMKDRYVFQQYGVENSQHCDILYKETMKLIQEYPQHNSTRTPTPEGAHSRSRQRRSNRPRR